MSQTRPPESEADRLPASIGVLIVDDQFAVREGLARLIACGATPLRYVSTAATCSEALSAAARLLPNVVVLDVDLDGEDGLSLIPYLPPTAGVLVLTSHGDALTRARAADLGALGFIEKHQPAAELLDAIERIGHLQSRGGQTSWVALAEVPLPDGRNLRCADHPQSLESEP
jgi:DNA-binding NarL/FixJ family response regulator